MTWTVSTWWILANTQSNIIFSAKKAKILREFSNKGTEREREKKKSNDFLPSQTSHLWSMENLSWQLLYPQILLFDFIPRYYYLSLPIGFQKMKEGELCYHKLCEREESEMIWFCTSFTTWNSHTSSEANSTSWESCSIFRQPTNNYTRWQTLD